MAKIQIKSEKLTPFGGIFSIMEKFDSMLSPVIDSTLGQRCSSIFGYQFSEIVRSLMSVYFCGGSCVEDVTSQLMRHLSYHPTLRTCSSDTILRAIKELTQENISYTSDQGKTYDFNTADKLNTLLINALVSTGELKEIEEYDVDFDHQFLETEKYDAKPTYKKFLGYRPGVYVIGDKIVYIENSDGNTAEYQKMIDADKSVKRLSAYTTRQRELAEIEDPDERNPKHAGRPKKPYTEKAQSKAIRVIGSIADQVKTINDFIREHPYEEDRVKFLLSSVIEQLK